MRTLHHSTRELQDSLSLAGVPYWDIGLRESEVVECRRADSQGLLPSTGGLTPNCPALPTDPRESADSNRSALLIDLTPVTDGHDNNQQDPITDGVDDSIVPNLSLYPSRPLSGRDAGGRGSWARSEIAP